MLPRRITSALMLVGLLLPAWGAAPAFAQEEESTHRYLSTNFSLTDVNVSRLLNRLARVGVRIPFEVEGNATARLRIQIPVNALRDTAAYRFNGTISSERLKVADLELVNVQMETDYRDGVLNLSPLSFQIPDTEADGLPPGTFRGTGRMELAPRGDLSLNLVLEDVPARAIAGMASQPSPLTAGTLAGTVEALVPAEDVGDISAWDIEGRFSGTGLEALDRVLESASFQFSLENGELNVTELRARMKGADLEGSAVANLAGGTAYSAGLELSVSDPAGLFPGTEAIEPAEAIEATANVNGTLSPLTFLASGQAMIPETRIGRLDIDSGGLDYSVTEDQFAINNLNLRLYQGAITGSARLPRQGEASGTLDVKLEPALDLRRLARDLSGDNLPLVGRVAGNITAEVPRQKLGDLSAWKAGMDVSILEGRAWGLAIQNAGLKVLVEEGVASFSETELSWASSTLDLSGQLRLAEPRPFEAEVKLVAGDLQDLNRLSGGARIPVEVAGRIQASANLKGQLEEFQWQADGVVNSESLRIDKVLVDSAAAEIAATPEEVTLKKFGLQLYKGQLAGRGQYPLRPEKTGEFEFDWNRIDVGQLLQQYLETETPITGNLAGEAKASLSAQPRQGDRQWTASADFSVPTLVIGTVEAANFTGALEIQNQRLEYSITGKVFEGDLEIEGIYPDEEQRLEPMGQIVPGQGRIQLEDLSLQQVWRAYTGDPAAANLSGTLDLNVRWSRAEGQTPAATGSVVVTNIDWNDQRISDRLEGAAQIRDSRLVADGIRGTLLGAELDAKAVWGLGSDRSRMILVHLHEMDLPTFLALTPFPSGIIEGKADIEAILSPRELWQLDVRLRSSALSVQGLGFQSVNLPFRGTVLPSFERGELVFRSAGASLAGGRIDGQVVVGWGERRRVTGELAFARVDTKTLVQQSLGSDLPGDGTLSGTLVISGQNLASWSDVTIDIDAELSRAQPRRLPVVEALQVLVKNLSFSQPVDEGQIVARYVKGAWIIDEMTLTGPVLELVIEGTISANRRVNWEVIVRTGRRSFDRRLTHLVGGQLGDRLWVFLADRFVRAQVTGTVDRPIVHVKPFSLVNIKAKQ